MKKIKEQLSELRKKTTPELRKELIKAENELVKVSIAISLQKEKNTSKMRTLRKNIARLKTLMNEVA